MYTPASFRNDDKAAAFELISAYGFATLITVEAGGAVVSHLPMIGDAAKGVLRGHLARANPHSALIAGRRHLALFEGANAYVSPDWYAGTQEVPTWNYSAVHIEGAANIIADPAGVDALLAELSDFHESRRHDLEGGKIWKMEKLTSETLRKMRAAIVAFEIRVERLEFKAKLSQNRTAVDHQTVAEKLASGNEGQRAVAAAMRPAPK